MKIIAVLVSTLSLAAAFAPSSSSRSTKSSTEMNALFDNIFGMDLYAPNRAVNEYGQRKNKNIKQGEVGNKSYVPAGLTLEEYKKVRSKDVSKFDSNYDKNVKKAGKFQDFDAFYEKRGTAIGGKWLTAPGKGHTFAKTKYDYSGGKDDSKGWGDAMGSVFGSKKK
eukprot:CAMPEP_0198137404 /NCGR_PEP_ID=MMETSP1443-20131203/885_1 /TAXON_ID=186043 /ORGANISM="Entomoneis sp., Strain CCMP2396" /LENGTH=165 /DNA_ID=CAMNT_0043798809 /DNA_START=88 /DNA_END=585 /DNA_ORIENTATION=-